MKVKKAEVVGMLYDSNSLLGWLEERIQGIASEDVLARIHNQCDRNRRTAHAIEQEGFQT